MPAGQVRVHWEGTSGAGGDGALPADIRQIVEDVAAAAAVGVQQEAEETGFGQHVLVSGSWLCAMLWAVRWAGGHQGRQAGT